MAWSDTKVTTGLISSQMWNDMATTLVWVSGSHYGHSSNTAIHFLSSQSYTPPYISTQSISGGTIKGGLHYPDNYIIYKENNTYYAKNAINGNVESSDSNANVPVQYAIDSLGTGGGSVYVASGLYIVEGTISSNSNLMLHGSGFGSLFKMSSNKDTWNTLLHIKSDNNVIVKDLAFHGNRENQHGGDDSLANGSHNPCIKVDNSHHVILDNLKVYHSSGGGIRIWSSTAGFRTSDINVMNCLTSGNNDSGILVQGNGGECWNIKLTNCTAIYTRMGADACFKARYAGLHDVYFENCYGFTDQGSKGVWVMNDARNIFFNNCFFGKGARFYSDNIFFSNCHFSGTTSDGSVRISGVVHGSNSTFENGILTQHGYSVENPWPDGRSYATLDNCTAIGNISGTGFYRIDRLNNCVALRNKYGFQECKYMENCYTSGNTTTDNEGIGFYLTNNSTLVNCDARGNDYGYRTTTNPMRNIKLISCIASGSLQKGIDMRSSDMTDFWLLYNDFRGETTDFGFSNHTDYLFEHNIGWVSENHGWAAVTDGATINHGCVQKPTNVQVECSGSVGYLMSYTVDTTNITVNHSGAPGESVDVNWSVEV